MKKLLLTLAILSTLSFANDLINKQGIKPDVTRSLEGIDKNDNGIRDDIEFYLKETYNQPDDKKYIISLSNISIIDNKLFEASDMMDILRIDLLLIERKKAEQCMRSIFTSKTTSSSRSYDFANTKYELAFLNTDKRKKSFLEIQNHYSDDHIFNSSDPKTCALKLITFED